jgi:hypothetical protein
MPDPQARDSEHIFISESRVAILIEQERKEYGQVRFHSYQGYLQLAPGNCKAFIFSNILLILG